MGNRYILVNIPDFTRGAGPADRVEHGTVALGSP
jgi:hypothetical protein